MSSTAELIAKAVADELDGLNLGFGVSYRPLPEVDLKKLGDPFCTTRLADHVITLASRSESQHDVAVEVCLRLRVRNDEDAALGTMMGHLEQFAEYYRFRKLAGRPERWVRTENYRIFEEGDGHSLRVYRGSVNLIFRGWKE